MQGLACTGPLVRLLFSAYGEPCPNVVLQSSKEIWRSGHSPRATRLAGRGTLVVEANKKVSKKVRFNRARIFTLLVTQRIDRLRLS
jgi:hypothetical protein